MTALSTEVASSCEDVRDALGLIKQYLTIQNTNTSTQKLFQQYKDNQDVSQISSLKRDINEIRLLLPTITATAQAVVKSDKKDPEKDATNATTTTQTHSSSVDNPSSTIT